MILNRKDGMVEGRKTIRIQVKTVPEKADFSDGYWAYDEPTEIELELDTSPRRTDAPIDPTENIPKWTNAFTEFTQYTSLHGWHFMTDEVSYTARKVFWFLVVASAFVLYLYFVRERVIFFYLYEKNVNVEIDYPSTMSFPAVTICNKNKFRLTKLSEHGWYHIITSTWLDSSSSTGVPTTACPIGDFPCAGGTECIEETKRCDLFPDCSDGSDEGPAGCPSSEWSCPLLQVDATADVASLLPLVVGFLFRLQPHTYWTGDTSHGHSNISRPFYVREDMKEDVFLFYSDDTSSWIFGGVYGSPNMSWAETDALKPQDVDTVWNIVGEDSPGTEVELVVTCAERYGSVNEAPDVPNADNLNLYELFSATAQPLDDFILKCEWKGKSCQEYALVEQWTDMGICWQFYDNKDSAIEQSGPGFGLNLLLNVGYYDYSMPGEGGIGIKILMHEYGNVPLVDERGTAVSPGLFSYVSVETSNVSSVEPPWGDCGQSPLYYYTFYSVSTCVAECESRLVFHRCGCIEPHQPQLAPGYIVCNVSGYVNCTQPYLNVIRNNNTCNKCLPPCLETTYIPTTSFATVFGNPLGSAIYAIESQLLRNLENATETAQRLMADKIKRTYRLFHDVKEAMLSTKRWSRVTLLNMIDEQEIVLDVASLLISDCGRFRDILTEVRDNITVYLEIPLATFVSAFEMRLASGFVEFSSFLNSTLENPSLWNVRSPVTHHFEQIHEILMDLAHQLNYTIDDPSVGNFQDTDVRQYEITIEHGWQQVVAALELIRGQDFNFLMDHIHKISSDSPLKFNKPFLDPIMTSIGSDCTQCMNENRDSLLDVLREDIENTVDIKEPLDEVHDMLLTLYRYNITDLPNARPLAINRQVERIYGKLKSIQEHLLAGMASLEEASQFVRDTIDYGWRLRCQAGTERILGEYHSDFIEVVDLLGETYDFSRRRYSLWESYQEKYWSETRTLAALAYDSKLDEIVSFLTRKETRLETSLQRRKQSVDEVRDHIGQLSYLLDACLDSDWLFNNSELWEHFPPATPLDIQVNPGVAMIPTPNYTLVLNDDEVMFWESLDDNLDSVMGYLETHMFQVYDGLTVSKAFLEDYLASLKLTDDFFAQNFLQLDVFFKELTIQTVTQNEAYTVENLLSELGGFMGLLLGASVISLMEFFDLLLFNWIRRLHAWCKMRYQMSVAPEDDYDQKEAWPEKEYC